MECSSCGALIPDDSMFCTECGARQVQSKAQSFAGATQGQNIGGGQGNFGRSFGAVSPEAIRNERETMNQQMGNLPPELLNQIASGIQSNQNMPPGQFPPQQFNQNQFNQQQNQFNQQQNQFNQQQNQFNQQQNQFNQNMQPQGMQNVGSSMKQSDMPNQVRGPSLLSGQGPTSSIKSTNPFTPGGTAVANNPSNSKTDAMVNQLAVQDREIKNERRSQWLNMNASPANEVLKNINSEIPAQFQGITQEANQAAQNLVGSLSGSGQDETLVRRICEVATRRVARKRGVAVETPQSSIKDNDLEVKITFIDDGRVLDSSEDLANAFKHAIHTELALKGMEFEISINLFSSKDGEVSLEIGSKGDTDEEEEMFACEICDGLVSENDKVCPHCGAVFEDEEDEVVEEQKSSPLHRVDQGHLDRQKADHPEDQRNPDLRDHQEVDLREDQRNPDLRDHQEVDLQEDQRNPDRQDHQKVDHLEDQRNPDRQDHQKVDHLEDQRSPDLQDHQKVDHLEDQRNPDRQDHLKVDPREDQRSLDHRDLRNLDHLEDQKEDLQGDLRIIDVNKSIL